ncbi:DUF1413 domain-containing protein [Clostridium sp. 001]|uniref:DUF1413 domain-containing protein n=1 Tax=Clostridium sp. 001 TaxID=1970093 RepID=UPI001C2C924E|nr:DUF1413 domain-containing protein [Clostridium sp. 001]QXE20048.1 hypothetical protein B5S50_15110 [Clostridium sp. 001]
MLSEISVDEIINEIKMNLNTLNSGFQFTLNQLVPNVRWMRCNEKMVGKKFRELVLNGEVSAAFAEDPINHSYPTKYVKI